MTATWRILEGDCRDVLATLPERSVHTVVTSPPYFGLRDYGTAEWEGGDPECDHRPPTLKPDRNEDRRTLGDSYATHSTQLVAQMKRTECGKCGASKTDRQIGLEPTPDEFVAAMVAVFREVRRVLRDDGTVWLNLGDSYATTVSGSPQRHMNGQGWIGDRGSSPSSRRGDGSRRDRVPDGWKPKDLIGIPWMVAFALRADGWYLRSDIIWVKPNPMPESVMDRPTKSHEYLFLLSKGPRYFYDADAIRETSLYPDDDRKSRSSEGDKRMPTAMIAGVRPGSATYPQRNKRSVWTVATQPYAGAHFATFPPKLIEPCILAGAPERACGVCGAPWVRVVERVAAERIVPQEAQMAREAHFRETRPIGQRGNAGMPNGQDMAAQRETRTLGFEPSCAHNADPVPGVVLDPFAGAGTTGMVALRHNRSFIGIELNPEYARMARERIIDDAPLLNQIAEVAA